MPLKIIGKVQILGDYYAIRSRKKVRERFVCRRASTHTEDQMIQVTTHPSSMPSHPFAVYAPGSHSIIGTICTPI
jgi:hypothetical protein